MWAKFIVDSSDPLVGVDPNIACNYMISDREVYPGGGMPIFQVNPLAAKKCSIISDHLYVADFANRPSAVDFPGLPIMIGNFGNAIAVSDGTNYLAGGRQYVYNEQNGTLTNPTKSSGTGTTSYAFASSIPNIPAGLLVPTKSVLRVNYSLRRRVATGTLDFAIQLGTVGNSSDPIVIYTVISAVDAFFSRGSSKLTFPDSTHLLSSRGVSDVGSGTNQLYEGGPTQFNTASVLIPTIRVVSKDTTVYADLIDLELIWER